MPRKQKKARSELTRKPVEFVKDEYGAIQVGKAAIKPDKILGYTEQVYKNSLAMSITRAITQSFKMDDEIVEHEGQQVPVVKIELAIIPNKNYEKMKRKIRRLEKKLKEANNG